MKIIIDTDLLTDNITAISASSEDVAGGFPASNLLNDFTTDLWRAAPGVVSATLTLSVSKGSAIELINTNATSAVITVGTGGNYSPESGFQLETGFQFETSIQGSPTIFDLPGVNGRIWYDYSSFSYPHIVKIELVADSTLYAGIVRAGNVEQFNDPQYKFKEGSTDYSIEKELNNGADYFRKRNIVKKFSNIQFLDSRANAFKLKHDIFDAVGPKPLAIYLVDTQTDKEFILFAKRISSPEIEYAYRNFFMISMDLKEVI